MATATANSPLRLRDFPALGDSGAAYPGVDDALVVWSYRRPTEEDVRVHAWLEERLALLEQERHGLWPSVRKVLHACPLTRWMVG